MIEKTLDNFSEIISEEDSELFEKAFEDFERYADISDDKKQRILSSVMRKAGYDMNENITVKRRKKKTLSVIILAAVIACLCGFTALAVYKYNYGNAFKSRMTENFKQVTGNVHELESTTQPFEGVILENTFEDIDFTIEGTVSDVGSDIVIVTARKKDATPFSEDDKMRFDAGLNMCIPCDSDAEIPDITKLQWNHRDHNFELNDDGSLTIELNISWKFDDKEEYDVILGFGDFFSYEIDENLEDECLDGRYMDFLRSFIKVGNSSQYYYNGDIVPELYEEYKQNLEWHKELYHELAKDLYEGTFIIKAHITANDFIIPPEETECGVKIHLSGMTCTMYGDGETFLNYIGDYTALEEMRKYKNNSYVDFNADLTIRFNNGSSFSQKCSYTINEDGDDNDNETSYVYIYNFRAVYRPLFRF